MQKENLSTNYLTASQLSDHQVLEQAAEIIANKYLRGDVFSTPEATKDFLTYKLGNYEREVFAVLMLDNQHRLIEFKELFFGTIDAASVYPREVVQLVLETNAAAVIFAHNHPSGIPEPSQADKRITSRLKDALALVDVRVLDHFIVGESCVSFAERGLV
ncbi:MULTISPECIES: DNA repair protein RadC [unclassified Vibrio]|uniref:RadC family protein n=1 Tax=unclassified Vibrio TaxID=2614977 RepID=UPI00148204CD|nr:MULTISPECIES: DNA repair protein RadC [unclassified Vibrio]EGR2323851.1 DNA repair protein RadC [Vibrio alginolyticus]NNN40421.1 DNA repair protein RadC [Vibrio sp. 2-2(2)]NNO05282.1 DNA repair protein RadC [Vibrio sp. 7-5(1-a)]